MPLYIAKSGDLYWCYRCLPDSLTHSLTTLKDRATQLLIKYKSGALVTQFREIYEYELEMPLVGVNLLFLRKFCKKAHCFLEIFTQLAQILHVRQLLRS